MTQGEAIRDAIADMEFEGDEGEIHVLGEPEGEQLGRFCDEPLPDNGAKVEVVYHLASIRCGSWNENWFCYQCGAYSYAEGEA